VCTFLTRISTLNLTSVVSNRPCIDKHNYYYKVMVLATDHKTHAKSNSSTWLIDLN